jgi:hypothetical protein
MYNVVKLYEKLYLLAGLHKKNCANVTVAFQEQETCEDLINKMNEMRFTCKERQLVLDF